MDRKRYLLPRWLPAVLLAVAAGACQDRVFIFESEPEGEFAFVLDGRPEGENAQTDLIYHTDTVCTNVGDMRHGADDDEITAFGYRRPPVATPAAWTDGMDWRYLKFPDEVVIPLTVWVLHGKFEEQKQRVEEALAVTTTILQNERTGVTIATPWDIRDYTQDSPILTLEKKTKVAPYLDFTCDMDGCWPVEAETHLGIREDVGFVKGRVNVYYVNTVNGDPALGEACTIPSDLCLLGSLASPELLAHELGHTFNLDHIDGFLEKSNVMHSASNEREFLTEGQTLRMHYDENSKLITLYEAWLLGDPTIPNKLRSLKLRVWDDE